MRVAIVSAVFPPEPLTSALAARDLAEELTRRGHEVTVFTTFPNRPQGCVFEGFSRRCLARSRADGYRVVRSWHTLSQRSTMASRFAENVSFGFSSSFAALSHGRFDVAYIATWPIFAQNLAAAAFRAIGTPVVCGVGDIYPETLTGKGMIPPRGLLANTMLGLDRFVLSRCASVIAVSDEMRDYLIRTRRLRHKQVKTVPNWLDFQAFDREKISPRDARKQLGIPDGKFVIMFAGAITMSAGVGLYLDAAAALPKDNPIEITIVGDGSTRQWVEHQAHRRQLANVRVIRGLSPQDVPRTQAAADALLLSLTGDSKYIAAPSKLIAYMFSAKPIVACVSRNSTPARILSEADCGVLVEPDRPDLLAQALVNLARIPAAERDAIGRRGRQYARTRFSKEVLVPRLVDVIESAGGHELRAGSLSDPARRPVLLTSQWPAGAHGREGPSRTRRNGLGP